eukprot:gene45897-57212_t
MCGKFNLLGRINNWDHHIPFTHTKSYAKTFSQTDFAAFSSAQRSAIQQSPSSHKSALIGSLHTTQFPAFMHTNDPAVISTNFAHKPTFVDTHTHHRFSGSAEIEDASTDSSKCQRLRRSEQLWRRCDVGL